MNTIEEPEIAVDPKPPAPSASAATQGSANALPTVSEIPTAADVPSTPASPHTAPNQTKLSSLTEKWTSTFGPRNKWRYGSFQCFDVCCTPLCLMSCCGWTHTIVMGQLMERMGLNWCGQYDPWRAHNTCKVLSIIWVAYLCLAFTGLAFLFLPFMSIFLLVLATRLRGSIRDRFSIPSEHCQCCNGSLEDCLCSCFCGCCSAIQMARQTHDENKFPYTPTTSTGLPLYAPLVFEHPMPEEMHERGLARPTGSELSPPPKATEEQAQAQQHQTPSSPAPNESAIVTFQGEG